MLDHKDRIATARQAIDYITSRSEADQARPVPNCPGWTVYNAASHIGRVSIAWEEMITSPPEDPESRTRGYARSAEQPEGAPLADLAAWSHAAIDHLVDDLDRRCYFSMTGGEGTAALWAWHAASELGVHRLDVEAALGVAHAQTDAQALDAATYTAQYFLPAMRRVTEQDPGGVTARRRPERARRVASVARRGVPIRDLGLNDKPASLSRRRLPFLTARSCLQCRGERAGDSSGTFGPFALSPRISAGLWPRPIRMFR